MEKISFVKMAAAGNDFIVIDLRHGSWVMGHGSWVKKMCDRKFGVGADGLLALEKSKVASVKMRVFNADGSEAEMCGNGARCAALYINQRSKVKGQRSRIEARAGIIEAEVRKDKVKIKLPDPKGIKLDLPLAVSGRALKVNFINTGVPHTVIFVEGLDKIDIPGLGRQIRYHQSFKPAGTNVDFVEVAGRNNIKVRTYERGVEDETLACGTGSAASALIFALKSGARGKVRCLTRSKEVLTIYFNKAGHQFSDVWLEGPARIVFKGEAFVKER